MLNLPPESATARSYTSGLAWGWSEEMATITVELLHAHLRASLRAWGVKKGRLPKPLTLDRPWEDVRRPRRQASQRRQATVEEVVQVMGGLGMGPPSQTSSE